MKYKINKQKQNVFFLYKVTFQNSFSNFSFDILKQNSGNMEEWITMNI